MIAARPFRWLFAFVALILPATLMTCRDAIDPAEAGASADAASQVVFRHYI